MRTMLRCLTPVLLMGLTACDPIYGLSRRARVQMLPAFVQVSEVLSNVPGIEKVEYQFTENKSSENIGIKSTNQTHTFCYSGRSNIFGVLEFTVGDKQEIEFRQAFVKIGRPRHRKQIIDDKRQLMKKIEAVLEEQCGFVGLRTSIVERCYGVKSD